MFCECWLSYLLLALFGETGLGVAFPVKKWPTACFFQATKIMDQSGCYNAQKNDPVCFPGWFEAATLLLSQEDHSDFAIWPGIPALR